MLRTLLEINEKHKKGDQMKKKYSIFRSIGNEEQFLNAYDETLKLWPIPVEDLMISTRFGDTHILATGSIDNPAIILFHGMTFSATMWYPNIESLSRYFRVYAVDTIGDVGKGSVTSILKTREEAVLWVLDVLDGLQLQSAIFIGHSLGGWFSLNFALSHPKRVNKLILLAPAAGIHKVTKKFIFKVFPAILFPSEDRIQKEISWFMSRTFQPDKKAKVLIRQFIISGMNCIPKLRITPTVFKDEELKRLSMSILVVVGDQEVIYDYQSMLSKAELLFPHIQTKVIQNAGHALTIEKHEQVNETLLNFLI